MTSETPSSSAGENGPSNETGAGLNAPSRLVHQVGSLTNDVYLSTIQLLERAVRKTRESKAMNDAARQPTVTDDERTDDKGEEEAFELEKNRVPEEAEAWSSRDPTSGEQRALGLQRAQVQAPSQEAGENRCGIDSGGRKGDDERGIKSEQTALSEEEDEENMKCHYPSCLKGLALMVTGARRSEEKAISPSDRNHEVDEQIVHSQLDEAVAMDTEASVSDMKQAHDEDEAIASGSPPTVCLITEEKNPKNVERKSLSPSDCRSTFYPSPSTGLIALGVDRNVRSVTRSNSIHSAVSETLFGDEEQRYVNSSRSDSGSVGGDIREESSRLDDSRIGCMGIVRDRSPDEIGNEESLLSDSSEYESIKTGQALEDEANSEAGEGNNMNYFRSRFHRQNTFNAESVLRDCSRRRRRQEREAEDGRKEEEEKDILAEARVENFQSKGQRVRSRQRQRQETDTMGTLQSKEAPEIMSPRFFRRRRARSSVNENASPAEPSGEPAPTQTVTLQKSSSLRRRRYPSDGIGDGSNPVKKGNFTVEVEETVYATPIVVPELKNEDCKTEDIKNDVELKEEVKAKEEEEEDPLDFIEIKSAAQWKAMSSRITWKFDEDEDKKSDKAERNFSIKAEDVASTIEGFRPTKVQQLRLVCWKVKPWNQPKKNPRLFSSQFAAAWGTDCDEVYPSLFIGDKASATNIRFLKKIGVTHVLNTAEGKDEGLVDLSQEHYNGSDITYLGFPLWDTPDCNIMPYLGCAADFIASAIDSGGKCLVNCQMGVSRSCSCAISYLLIKKELTAVEALTHCRQNRDVRPNDGFLQQLAELDNDLRKNREHGEQRSIRLSSLADHQHLPQPWNHEFWTKPVTEEEIEMPLVPLGAPCPLPQKQASLFSSKASSRRISRRGSTRRSRSRKSSSKSSRSISRHSSFKSVTISTVTKDKEADNSEDEDNWEWEWEDEEEGNEENVDPGNQKPIPSSAEPKLTEEELLKVKDIIEKPEERWRILWQKDRHCESRSSIASSNQSNCSKASNIIQPGIDDPLSLVKVTSAKQWKSISQKLSINLDGIDLNEDESKEGARVGTPSEFKPTTVQQLRLLCWRIKPWNEPKARHLFSSLLASSWGVDCDEVYPNIFIGDEASARNIKFLQKMGITHVLNAAQGIWTNCSFVDLNEGYYEGSSIVYQGFELWDSSHVKILPFFGCANEFIISALKGGGKCLVNCQMGVSRSCTLAMAYMMLSEGWDAVEVMREFRKRRDVRPNDYFMSQIVELDNELRKERLFGIKRTLKLHSLADVPNLPKPWHVEFWDSAPDPSTLPFKLCHQGDAGSDTFVSNDLEGPAHEEVIMRPVSPVKDTLALPTAQQSDRSRSTSVMGSESEYEWEYYSDTEEDAEEAEPEVKDTVSTYHSIGNAKEWMEISSKLNSGVLAMDVEATSDMMEQKEEEQKSEFVPTLEKQLRIVCWQVKPWKEKKSSRMFSSQFALLWNVDCDEVHPNLLIGDAATAKNIKFLKHLNITHVLNTAEGKDEGLVDVNTGYYEGSDIAYKGFLMWDSTWFDIAPFIDEAVHFIANALSSGGKCLVNCQMGVSRSSTCAIAYMMKELNFRAVEALRQFRTHRDVRPNDGFLKYLVRLDNELRRVREG